MTVRETLPARPTLPFAGRIAELPRARKSAVGRPVERRNPREFAYGARSSKAPRAAGATR